MRRGNWAWFLYRLIRAFVRSSRRTSKAKPSRFSSNVAPPPKVSRVRKVTVRGKPNGAEFRLHLPDAERDRFVEKMEEIASTSNGEVQVFKSAGRRTQPEQLEISTLDAPQPSLYGETFISAKAVIDYVHYGFHAYPHPTANAYSRYWLYFSVTGPTRETGKQSEFQITDTFSWTGERPLNPMLVKHALRLWIAQPDVQAAIAAAKRKLVVPVKRIPPPPETAH